MKKILPVFLFLFFFLFWYLIYPNHISNQEYFSLFQTNFDYFLYLCKIPGGMAEWCGAFISQFYRWTWLGALIQTLLTGMLYFFACKNRVFSAGKGTYWCLWPVIGLFFLQMQYSFLVGNSLQVIFGFAFIWFYTKIGSKNIRLVWIVLGCYPLIMFTGTLPSIVWVITVLLYEWRQSAGYQNCVAAILTWSICFFLWRHFFPVNDAEWITFFPDVHEFLSTGIVWLLYLWWPVSLSILMIGKQDWFPVRTLPASVTIILVLMGSCAILYWGKKEFYYPEVERMLGLQKEAIRGNWEAVLKLNPGEQEGRVASYVLTNLALAHRNELAERALDFPQIGINGLMPNEDKSYFGTLCRSWVYDWLGVKNEALHWSVETTIAHGDFPPPFLLKQIVSLLMDMGKEPAAARFLKRLIFVPFYRDWARENLKRVAGTEYQRKMMLGVPFRGDSLSVKEDCRNDFFVGAMGPLGDLFQLAERYPHHTRIRDYLLTGLLLEKDITSFYEWFRKYYPEGYPGHLPRLYRQALIIVGFTKLDTEVNKKYRISVNELQQFGSYMDRCRTFGGNKEVAAVTLREECGNTFWYYMHFR